MELVDVKTLTDIKQGDTIIITGDNLVNEAVKLVVVKEVKVTEHYGTEIIFNEKINQYFNLGMYLEGKSWVKEVKILK